jgi:DmsE family decaheme c-type cytochrome
MRSLTILKLLLITIVLLLTALPATWAQERTYVGADACSLCHADHDEWTKVSVHAGAVVKTKAGEEVTGCESCHGPGSEHVEDMTPGTIRSFRRESAKDGIDTCLACHGETHAELNYRRSAHMKRDVSCTDCHLATTSEGFHKMRVVDDVMRDAQPKVCYECHTDQRGSFALPYHHPVEEKFMGCTACHDPHGTFTAVQMKRRNTETVCTKCHEDTSGPFIFEHPPGRASGCVSCHQPHGSTNPRMLNRAQTQFLCLECHTNTPVFHDLSQDRYRNCTACHSQVHGSNLNRHLFE